MTRVAGCIALALLALGAQASAQDQRLRIPAADLARVLSDSAIRAGVPVLSRRGVATAEVAPSGELVLEQGTFAVLRTGEAVREVPGPLGAPGVTETDPEVLEPFRTLPYRYVTPDATATGSWVLRPVYKVASRLRWEPESGLFRGALLLTIEDSLRRAESRPLDTPIRFQILADAGRVDPEQIALAHTNFPLERVELVARNVTDSLRVHIVPEFDVRGIDLWVPAEPSLIVETSPRIQGWGVGSARVTVRVIGVSGVIPDLVHLSASDGELDIVSIPIGGAGAGTTRLRSAGIGPATLTATAPGFSEAVVAIQFTWPFVFFLAALLGGVFGGLAAAAQSRKGRQKTKWRDYGVKGVFAGLLAAAAWYALGVNLLQIDLGVPRVNELAVFAFAALAGYFGIPLLRTTGSGTTESGSERTP